METQSLGHNAHDHKQIGQEKFFPDENDESPSAATQQVKSEYQETQKSNKSDDVDSTKRNKGTNKLKFISMTMLLIIISSVALTALVLAAVSYIQSESPNETNLLSGKLNQLTAATESNLSQALIIISELQMI